MAAHCPSMRADAPIFVPSKLKQPEKVKSEINCNTRQRRRPNRCKRNTAQKEIDDDVAQQKLSSAFNRQRVNKSRRRMRKTGCAEEKQLDSSMNGTKGVIINDSMWSAIALDAHVQSERKKAEYQCQKSILQHQKDTFTRLHVLKPVHDSVNTIRDTKCDKKDNLKVNQQENGQINDSIFFKCMNMEKLRKRWLFAYEEKRKQEEVRIFTPIKHPQEPKKTEQESVKNICKVSEDAFTSSQYSDDDYDNIQSINETENLRRYLDNEYPLHSAIQANDEQSILKLLDMQSDVSRRNELIPLSYINTIYRAQMPSTLSRLGRSFSVVTLALLLHRPNLLRLILSHIPRHILHDVMETVDDLKRTPIMLASEFALDGCVKVLLSFGAKVNSKHSESGDTPLHFACQCGDLESVKLLMGSSKVEADKTRAKMICNRNRRGETPLHIVCSNNSITILETIIGTCNNASLEKALSAEDQDGNIPLFLAIANSADEIVSYLLTSRCNHRSYVEDLTKCPLVVAVESKSLNMIHTLLECRSNHIFKDFDLTGGLCKALLCFSEESNILTQVCEMLIAEGANPHEKRLLNGSIECIQGESALMISVLHGQTDIVGSIIACYDTALRTKFTKLVNDPVLHDHQTFYFQSKNQINEEEFQSSVNDCFVAALTSELSCSEALYTLRLKGCVELFRFGATVNSSSLSFLMKHWMHSKPETRFFPVEDMQFSSTYDLLDSCYSNPYTKEASSYDNDVLSSYEALIGLQWAVDRWNDNSPNCDWIRSKYISAQDPLKSCESDLCILQVEGVKLTVHKTIIRKRSGKLDAALSFNDISNSEDDTNITELRLDAPITMICLLLEHIYHGSIVSCLSNDLQKCCEQLLELYHIAQEYICPTLAQEVEMRLLSSDPYRCYCWYCSDVSHRYSRINHSCSYRIKVRTLTICL